MQIDLVEVFPQLATEPYARTSPCSVTYNCFAYAAGDQTQRWDPTPPFHWPEGVPRRATVDALTVILEQIGYGRCDDPELEHGFEKIAIYAKANAATHAARQLPDGQWTSKLGDLDDITHTLLGLIGDIYGQPVRYLRRAITPAA